jgi:hypothetical protein
VLGETQITGRVVSPRKLNAGETWEDSGLKRIISWEIVDCDGIAKIHVRAYDNRVIARKNVDPDPAIAHDTTLDSGCISLANSVYQVSLLYAEIDGSEAWVIASSENDLAMSYNCCEEL